MRSVLAPGALHPGRVASAATRLGLAALLGAGVLLAASVARANGRFPAAGQIVVNPSNPDNLVVRATYGILVTQDRGAHWGWVCETAVGYGGVEDPAMGIMKDGTLLAGVFEGLAVSRDGACQWGFSGGGLAGHIITDVSVDRTDPSRAIAIFSDNAPPPAGFLTEVWATADDAKTWQQVGGRLPSQLLALTGDVAQSDPNRIYLSGISGPPAYPGVLERSTDRGLTWKELPIAGADESAIPYIAAIDPKNPDVLYVRLHGPACSSTVDVLVVSRDGGGTWSKVFETHGANYLEGFALSPDGATIALGAAPAPLNDLSSGGCMPDDAAAGLWRGAASTLAFEKVSSISAECLTWTSAGLFACANEFRDGFTAGLSTDLGDHFTPLMHLQDLSPLTCGPHTSVGGACPGGGTAATGMGCCAASWPQTAATIGASGGGGSSGASTGPPSVAGAASKGCGCSLPAGTGAWCWPVAVAGLVYALRRRIAVRKRAERACLRRPGR